MDPLVSIIIPYYHGERFIQETLDSLFSQDYKNIEILIINDGSPEETLKPLEPYRNKITIINQQNAGQAAARNNGVRAARGSIIGFIDQDDIWPVGRLRETVQALKEHDYVRGLTVAFEIHADGSRSSSEAKLLPVLVGAALYRRSVFDSVGFLDEAMREGDDFDWNVRINESSLKGATLDSVTLLYRKHGDNNSIADHDFVKNGIFATLRRKLDRKKSTSHTP
jgi:glycosyltransferase involved in cell wall biosynthesis